MVFSNRRGRKKTQHPKIDYGTPELRLKKMAVTGSQNINPIGSDSLLGILWNSGKIDEGMYRAGNHIQKIYYDYTLTFSDGAWYPASHEAQLDKLHTLKHLLETGAENSRELITYKVWTQTDEYLRELGKKPYNSVMKVSLLSSPYELPPTPVLKNARLALFCLDNWLKTGNSVRVARKYTGT